ncbi:MAG: DNA repair protein RecO [Alphaproteobacteria bacterium]|nr:DNA repair protein RecO [Alphaproteobacteria bacterium]
MFKISDIGFTLSVRRYGEHSFILSVLTQNNGKVTGLLRGKRHPLVGNFISLNWQARLSEHLGTISYEDINSLSALYMDDRKRLACISALTELLNTLLPERENVSVFYEQLVSFTRHLNDEDWLKHYILLEVSLLKTIGFGLDLTTCAAGGNSNDLAYVSPKTGRAVSKEKGLPYHDKLLHLPKFLWQNCEAETDELRKGLYLTGFFLSQHIKEMPLSRSKLL